MSLMDLQGLQEPVNLSGGHSLLSVSGVVCVHHSVLSIHLTSCR